MTSNSEQKAPTTTSVMVGHASQLGNRLLQGGTIAALIVLVLFFLGSWVPRVRSHASTPTAPGNSNQGSLPTRTVPGGGVQSLELSLAKIFVTPPGYSSPHSTVTVRCVTLQVCRGNFN